MEFGVHLPLLAFRGQSFSLSRLVDYAETAERLGFTTLCVNDHLTFSRPWLDSVTALASILTKTAHMTLMTTVALPVIRGPVQLAKSLAALDVLSGGRLIAGVGPGSLPQDYALVGITFEERWKRFDEAIQLLRSLLQRDAPPFSGQFYAEVSTPTRTLSSSGAGRADLDWQLGIGGRTASGGSSGGWLARFRLSRHPSVVRRRLGATEPVSASSRQGARALPTRAGLDVLLSDGGPTHGRRNPRRGGESDTGSPSRAVARATAHWNTCSVRRKTGQAQGSRGPQGLPVACRGRGGSVGEVPRASPSSAPTVAFHVLALDEASTRPLYRRGADPNRDEEQARA